MQTKQIVKKRRRRNAVPVVSVIIPAHNEARTLRATLQNLSHWKLAHEIIVIANGCTDRTVQIARRFHATVIEFADRLGHDTGRAIGAKRATGKYLIFVDGDIVWRISDLLPFVRALRNGVDVALNTYPRPVSAYYQHRTAIAKRALNIALGRSDLRACSMTAVPHGIRASVLTKIDWKLLAIPPLAQAHAVLQGCKVEPCHFVNVRLRNRLPRRNQSLSATGDMIIGDHIQAFHYLLTVKGERGGYTDYLRDRSAAATYTPQEQSAPAATVVAIVPAKNEAKQLGSVLREIQKSGVSETCVVENGSSDGTAQIAQAYGIRTIHFDHALGHDVGRAIGAIALSGSVCTLFMDADFPIPSTHLVKWIERMQHNEVDIGLNDLTRHLSNGQKRDVVSTLKAFLNIALGRPDLGIASMTAVPHALSQKAVTAISAKELLVPPKAMVRGVMAGCSVKAIAYVDVITPNKYRRAAHSPRYGAKVKQMIIGDHIEALALLLQMRGPRGGFRQPRKLGRLDTI